LSNRITHDLRTMVFRDYSTPTANDVSTILNAPYAKICLQEMSCLPDSDTGNATVASAY